MKNGICRLCLQNKPLINISHIISDFFYNNDIYGEDHEAYMVSLKHRGAEKKVYTGEFESGILCQDCDNGILGKYENYGSAFIYGTSTKKILTNVKAQNQLHKDGKLKSTHITGIDYTQMKLFMLSLLWRASISNRPFFDQVDLGKYENELRLMLLNSNPKEQLKFPTMVSIITDHNRDISKGIISAPSKFRHGHCIAYQFQIGRLIFMYFISPTGIPSFIKEVSINEKGEMLIPHLENETSDRHMKFILGEELHNHLLKNLI